MSKYKFSSSLSEFKYIQIGITEIIFSFIFSLIFIMGHLLTNHEIIDLRIGRSTIAAYLFSMILIWVIALLGFIKAKGLLLRERRITDETYLKNLSDRKLWLLSSILIFACYLPIILLGYSVLTPDSWSSVRQITGDIPLSNAHPIIFTAFAGVFIRLGLILGSFELGLILFSLVQSAILAIIFALVIVWMRRQHINKTPIVVTFIFYAVLPVNSFAGMVLWKDILFAGIGLLLLIAVRQLYVEKSKFFTKRKVFLYIILAFLFCAWRNNGFYAYILFAITAVFIDRKVFFSKRYILLLCSPIILILIYSVLTSLISRPTSKSEALSVPLQQIARTVKYHDSTIDEDDKRTIDEVLPLEKLSGNYNPNLSDPIKSSFDVKEFDEDEGKYVKLWLELLMDHKKTYSAAFLYNTYGYTYPFYSSPTTTDIVLNNASHFNAVAGYSDTAFNRGSKNTLAEYRDIISSLAPVLRNIGFYFCVILFCLYIAIIRKRRELVGVFIILSAIFLTTILGPVNGEFRYLYLFVVATPFVIGSVFSRSNYKRSN